MQIFGGACIFGLLCSVLLVKGGEEWGGGEGWVDVKGRITGGKTATWLNLSVL